MEAALLALCPGPVKRIVFEPPGRRAEIARVAEGLEIVSPA